MHPPKQRHTTGIILGVLAALLTVGVLSFLYRSQVSSLAERILPRCFVGFQGTSASITVIGIDAETTCQQFIQSFNHACDNKQNCEHFTLYEMSSEPTQPEVCEGDYQNNHLIIRDEGIFKLVGNFLCSKLFPSRSTTPTQAPTQVPTKVPQTLPNEYHVYDAANVLDISLVQRDAESLPYSMDIYTTNTFNGTTSAFDQRTSGHLTSSRLIVIAIDTVHKHLDIVGGGSVPLSTSQYNNSVQAFINSYRINNNYTRATIAAIDSLRSSLAA